MIVGRGQVSKSDSQHDSNCPIIGPDIFLNPARITNTLNYLPVAVWIAESHQIEDYSYSMSECQIKQYNFNERPITFIILALKDPLLSNTEFGKHGWNLKDEK